MNHSAKKPISVLMSAVIICSAALASGCRDTSESLPTVPISSTPASAQSTAAESSTGETSSIVSSVSSTISSFVPESSAPESSNPESDDTPHFSFPESSPLPIPSSANIQICSLSEALANFSAISAKVPEGSPEEIVKTLLEKNILCFAAMQGKCWTSPATHGNALIQSSYITSAQQMNDLFYGTYTENQAWRLFHPQQADGYGNLFHEGDGGVYFDMQHLRRYHTDSFATATYAAITEATDTEITFGRYYESNPTENSKLPNTMLFKAIKESGAWRLKTYITDAEPFIPQYSSLITTGRKGAPELMELAKREVGNIGGEKYWDWYGFDYHVEWCAAFVSWCYAQAGKEKPYFLGCESGGKQWFQAHGKWEYRGYEDIAPGDCIFFDWDLNGSADHVGLVVGTDGTNVYTIEGNRDDVCIAKTYPLTYAYLLGYGLMDWDDVG